MRNIKNIPDKFLELYYIKNYLKTVKNNEGLFMFDKLYLHPNLTTNDKD